MARRIAIVGATSAIAEHCARLWLAEAPAEFTRRAHALADAHSAAEGARKEAADALALGLCHIHRASAALMQSPRMRANRNVALRA